LANEYFSGAESISFRQRPAHDELVRLAVEGEAGVVAATDVCDSVKKGSCALIGCGCRRQSTVYADAAYISSNIAQP
jgi:hypothetical protein